MFFCFLDDIFFNMISVQCAAVSWILSRRMWRCLKGCLICNGNVPKGIFKTNYWNIWQRRQCLWWFSVGICKYKLGYKSHDLLQIKSCNWKQNVFLEKKSLQDISSTMQALKFITGRVIYNPAYTYKFQLKTPLIHTYKIYFRI